MDSCKIRRVNTRC